MPQVAAGLLGESLEPDEVVTWITIGFYAGGRALVAATQARVLVTHDQGARPLIARRYVAKSVGGAEGWTVHLRQGAGWRLVQLTEEPPAELNPEPAAKEPKASVDAAKLPARVSPATRVETAKEPEPVSPPAAAAVPEGDTIRHPAPAAVPGETSTAPPALTAAPRPAARPPAQAKPAAPTRHISSWREAEEWAAWHLRTLGFADATVTRASSDGGLDVASRQAAAQVKHHRQPAGSPVVQQLQGAAHGYETKVFYCLSGFTPAAKAFALESGIALFSYDESGTVTPQSQAAIQLLGRLSRWRYVPPLEKTRKETDRAQAEFDAAVAQFRAEVVGARRRLRTAKGLRATFARKTFEKRTSEVTKLMAEAKRRARPAPEVRRDARTISDYAKEMATLAR